jgi:hypothetical protein
MNNRTRTKVVTRLIVTLFIAVISAACLVPAANAQTLTIASSNDFNTPIWSGDVVQAGFQLALSDGQSPASTISVPSAIGLITVNCPDGKSQTITLNFSVQSISVPAKNAGWFPGGQNTYQAQATAPPNLCKGKQGFYHGCIFTLTYSQKCDRDGDKDDSSCCHPVCCHFHFGCLHFGSLFGGDWDDANRSCSQPPTCVSGQNKNGCSCRNQH